MYTQLMDLLDQLKAKSSFPILGSSQKKGQSRIDYFKFAVSPLRMLTSECQNNSVRRFYDSSQGNL